MPASIRDVALFIVGQICVGHYHVDSRSVSAAVMSSEMHCFSFHRHREDSLGNEMHYKQLSLGPQIVVIRPADLLPSSLSSNQFYVRCFLCS